MAKVELKQPIVQNIAECVKDAPAVILVDYRGLTVEQDTQFRREMREAGINYKVFKNTMMKRAFEGTVLAELDPYLEGPSAVAISGDDVTAPARIISKYSKINKDLQFKAGVVEGVLYNEAQLQDLASIPAKEVLLSRLLGSMLSPIANFARVINQIAEKGGAPEAAEAPAAEEAAPAEAAPAEEAPAAEEAAPAEEAPAADAE